MKKNKELEDEEDKPQFDCPFCTFFTDDFEESDMHYEEHITDYQYQQDNIFGKFSK